MDDEKFFTIKNITEEQLNIIYGALNMRVSAGLLQFENCIDDFKYSSKFKIDYSEVDSACENLRHVISKTNPNYENYPKDARWNLGAYNDDVSDITKSTFDLYLSLKAFLHDKQLPKATNDSNIKIVPFILRKEKIKNLLNKKEDI